MNVCTEHVCRLNKTHSGSDSATGLSHRALPVGCILLTEGDPVGGRLPVDPEADPREDDEQAARHVDVDEEVAHVTAKGEVHVERRELAWAPHI